MPVQTREILNRHDTEVPDEGFQLQPEKTAGSISYNAAAAAAESRMRMRSFFRNIFLAYYLIKSYNSIYVR